ncbi:MAG: helix-turn-helix domain-containing protein, partial [Acidimicrobiales bacterium]
MTDLTAHEAVRATYDPIHDIGTALYLNPETMARAAEWGWKNPFAFYFAGRGGVLGDVGPDLVAAAMGWFNPALVSSMYEEGAGIHGPSEAGRRMFEAHALWGRDHFADVPLARFVPLADRLVDGAEGSGLPLFVGWRSQPRVADVPGRAAQLFQILREW